jgi:putative membrane protein
MEMFLWTTPKIIAIIDPVRHDFSLESSTSQELAVLNQLKNRYSANFHLTLEQAILTAPLAANQGLYNGFLAIGLLWAWFAKRADVSISRFFLICIIIAGLYGAATVKPAILLVQALPATISLLLIVLRQPTSLKIPQKVYKAPAL